MKIGDRHSVGFGRVAFDMGLVVASVLLALALGNWREDREKQTLTNNVLAALAQEIDANRAAIESSLDYQQQMTAEFRAASELFDKTREFRFPEGARDRSAAVRFSRAAYDSALVSQVLPRLGIDTLLKLSALYAEQDAYADMRRTYAGATIQTDFADGSRYLRLKSNQYAEMVSSERRLLPILAEARKAVAREAGSSKGAVPK